MTLTGAGLNHLPGNYVDRAGRGWSVQRDGGKIEQCLSDNRGLEIFTMKKLYNVQDITHAYNQKIHRLTHTVILMSYQQHTIEPRVLVAL